MGRKDNPVSNKHSTGALLRQARQAKGITLTRMAELIFYSKSYLSSIENEKAHVTAYVHKRYEETLERKIGDSQ